MLPQWISILVDYTIAATVTDKHLLLRNILLTLEKYVEAMMTVRRGERGEEKQSMVELCMLVDVHMMGEGGREGGKEGGVVTGNVNLLCILVEFKRKNYNATFFVPA